VIIKTANAIIVFFIYFYIFLFVISVLYELTRLFPSSLNSHELTPFLHFVPAFPLSAPQREGTTGEDTYSNDGAEKESNRGRVRHPLLCVSREGGRGDEFLSPLFKLLHILYKRFCSLIQILNRSSAFQNLTHLISNISLVAYLFKGVNKGFIVEESFTDGDGSHL